MSQDKERNKSQQKAVAIAKRVARPRWTSADWMKRKLASKFDAKALLAFAASRDTTRRIDPRRDFFRTHVVPRHVAVLRSAHGKAWPGIEWSWESLVARYGQDAFRLDDDHDATLRLNDFAAYAQETLDDDPLMIFDSKFGDPGRPTRALAETYSPPTCCRGDNLFDGLSYRPPYRWVIIAPERSGTALHVDPLGTSAWNTLTEGLKIWAVLPAHTDMDNSVRMPAAQWFRDMASEAARKGAVFLVQRAGETVFVPGGRPHVVLNLTRTVAVTENFAPRAHFDSVWRRAIVDQPQFARRWLRKLGTNVDKGDAKLMKLARSICASDARFKLEKSDDGELEDNSSSSSDSDCGGEDDRRIDDRCEDDRRVYDRRATADTTGGTKDEPEWDDKSTTSSEMEDFINTML